jgi:hypothetical protein
MDREWARNEIRKKTMRECGTNGVIWKYEYIVMMETILKNTAVEFQVPSTLLYVHSFM